MFSPENIENEFFLKLGFSFDARDLAKGKLLISEPFLGDPNFNRSVVLLLEYDAGGGAFGVVLNKPTELYMSDIIEEFPSNMFPFHYGGPVEQDNLFFIHRLGEAVQDAKPIAPGLWWGGNFEQLKQLILNGSVGQDEVLFFGGYSGWEAEQLEGEVKDRSWILNDLPMDLLWSTPADQMWRKSLKNLGSKFSIMADFPENPGLN
jgi:putative transcriptional regulator